MADIPAWHAKGEWFDVCRCNVPCPCSWAQAPDDDYCDGVLVWHIREGRYGEYLWMDSTSSRSPASRVTSGKVPIRNLSWAS